MLSASPLSEAALPGNTPVTFDSATGQVSYGTAAPETEAGTIGDLSTEGFAGLLPADFGLPTGEVPADGLSAESVGGTDERILVSNTGDAPFRRIVKIEVTWPNGVRTSGSGFMVSPYHLLTAGHVVHNDSRDPNQTRNGYYQTLTVYPGQDGQRDFGAGDGRIYGEAKATRAQTYTGWTNSRNPSHDWALVTLDRNIGNQVGWFGYGTRADSYFSGGSNVNLSGYPGDRDSGARQYRSFGPTLQENDFQFSYDPFNGHDTAGGQSGSPVWQFQSPSTRTALGIHSYGWGGGNGNNPVFGGQVNSATRINSDKFSRLGQWISDGTAPTDRADLVPYDEWFDPESSRIRDELGSNSPTAGGAFSIDANVRNNGTANSGNFTVHFYASTNTTISSGDTLLGSVTTGSLTPFQGREITWNGTLPSSLAGQSVYFGYLIDQADTVDEFEEGNNTRTPINDSALLVGGSSGGGSDNNDQFSEAIVIAPGGSYSASIDPNTDVDMFRIEGLAGQQLAFDTDPFSNADTVDTEIRLFDSSGNLLDVDDDGEAPGEPSDLYSYLEYTLPAEGTYYLGVANYTNNNYDPITGDGDSASSSDTGSYELFVTLLGTASPSPQFDPEMASRTVPADGNLHSIRPTTTVTDFDSPNLGGGVLEVAFNMNRQAPDRLRMRDAFGVTGGRVQGGTVAVDGVGVGTVRIDTGVRVIIDLNSDATPARVTNLVRAIGFATIEANDPRKIRVTLSDGDGNTTDSFVDVAVTGGTSAPQFGGLSSITADADTGDFSLIAPTATVSDFDNSGFDGGLLRAFLLPPGRERIDRVLFFGTARVGRNAADRVFVDGVYVGDLETYSGFVVDIRLNSNANADRVAALTQAMRFKTVDAGDQRTVRLVLQDASGRVGSAEVAVDVTGGTAAAKMTPYNPVRNANPGQLVSIMPVAEVTDRDSSDFDGGLFRAVILSQNRIRTDQVVLRNVFGVQRVGNAIRVDGVQIGSVRFQRNHIMDIQLNGNATPARMSQIVKAFSFRSGPSGGRAVTVRYVLSDGDGRNGFEQVRFNLSGSRSSGGEEAALATATPATPAVTSARAVEAAPVAAPLASSSDDSSETAPLDTLFATLSPTTLDELL